ncbi:hypothetical protein HRbin17_01406 [bacterium HR17]|uniref:Uncharacterized protein n=1 Tax=Candidatus Fervidibacter japonicus TaxID=2035412 RepID=A0A2H5XCH4_9BACT|nr:hypothetical protein HRbin17_01406 [bacterium HR17]
MRREVPLWAVVVIVAVVVVAIAVVFWTRMHPAPQDVGNLPVNPEALTQPRPGGPYSGKGLPPGALGAPPAGGQQAPGR